MSAGWPGLVPGLGGAAASRSGQSAASGVVKYPALSVSVGLSTSAGYWGTSGMIVTHD